ncbi:hypothetical protein BaRGS_00009520 [Batillaria attramentaria]|uniref:Ankyrin repeat protein n=1 Tax=Batillaria attramentaria TaxID=370345 RepID=A0ABD0LIQ8_9CAEN|nr:hypothetical protein BaRGS_021153 [Batillaria attramentaria]
MEAGSDERNIFIAISSGKVNRLHSILANIEDLNVRDTSLRTPLIHAVFISNDDIRTHIVRLLLRHGCDVNAQDGVGRTALMYACMERDKMDVVRLLAKCRRCDPNVQDDDGNTALIHSVESGNASSIRILTNHTNMKSRLKVNMANRAGLTALEMAVKLGLPDCCRILMKDGGADSTRIKNRELLLDLINEDRTRTPFDVSASPAPRADDSDFQLPSPRSQAGSFSHRPGSESFRARSDTGAKPGSDVPGRAGNRSVLSLRKDISCEVPSSQRPVSREWSNVGVNMNSPFLEMVRQDSSLYVPNSRTTFRRAIISSKDSMAARRVSGEGQWMNRQSASRRPLTPIASRGSDESRSISPVGGLPLPSRLPSIPSGKRLYSLMSPCETPTESA